MPLISFSSRRFLPLLIAALALPATARPEPAAGHPEPAAGRPEPVEGSVEGPSATDTSESDINRQFQQRRAYTLQQDLALVDPRAPAKSGMTEVAASYYSHANLDWANARLAKLDAPMPTADMFWMFPMVAVMETGRDAMSAVNQARIRELWRTYFPYRGDTENHWLLYYASLYLAAEANPDAGPSAWYNGKSSAENMAEAHSYIEDWLGITTSIGQGEFNSPNYLEEYTAPLALLAGWAKEPKLRREARMILDVMYYEYAVQQLDGEYGGAHSRVYPQAVVEPGNSRASEIGWLLFGLGDYKFNGVAVILAMSGYTPPPILWRIAHDRSQPYAERELQRTRWRMRYAGPKAIDVEGKMTVPVYKYTYMDPDFVIGSCQGGLLQPIQQETWSLIWRNDDPLGHENTFFGLQPYSSPLEGAMYFACEWDTSTGLICRSKADYDSPDKLEGGSPYEQVFQQGPALIALYDMPPGARFPCIDTFFSHELARRDADKSGWIFCQGGPAYFGYRPFASGEWKPMGWTGLLDRGAGGIGFSKDYDKYSIGNKCLVSDSLKNGYIVQVAPARAYKSFEEFKAAVRALPLHFTLDPVPEADFTALDGTTLHARYGDRPMTNGALADYGSWPLFESPFCQSASGSRRIELRYGAERYLLDFNTTVIKDSFVPEAL